MHTKAPVALFVYNRPEHTKKTLERLSKNVGASELELYVFADGAKANSSAEDLRKIKQVRELIAQQTWPRKTTVITQETNQGLARSIISGVSKVLDAHDAVIVLEDDICTSPAFLSFMWDALACYQQEKEVMHISGYTFPIRFPREYTHETYFTRLPFSWGWATWKDRWESFEYEPHTLWKSLKERKLLGKMDFEDTNDFHVQLTLNLKGKINTWAVFWYATMLLRGGLALCPTSSLVENIGNDGSGENSPSVDVFSHNKLSNKVEVEQILAVEDKAIFEQLRAYFQTTLKKNQIKLFIQRKWDELFV